MFSRIVYFESEVLMFDDNNNIYFKIYYDNKSNINISVNY